MKRILFLVSVCFSCCFSYATNYFCSPTGSGDGMSYNSPCSFTSGISKLTAAGDTLFCLGGQYDFSTAVNITISCGTAARNVVICNYPGEKPILDWRREAYGDRGLVFKTGTQHLTVKGLVLRYTGKNALLNNGSYCTFENIEAYGNGDTGIQMKGGGNNYIINCDSHDNFDYRSGDLTAANYGGNADGFADKQFSGGPNTYIGCRAWNNSDDGWDFFQRVTTGSTPSILQNCICYHNGPASYNMTNHARYETDKSWFDQFKSGKQVTDRYGAKITVTLETYNNIGNGNGFKIGGDHTANNIALYHCLAVGNTARGFDQNNNCGPMIVYNGSAYLNGTDYGFGTKCDGTLIIKNCISYKNTYNFSVSNTQSNNSWSDNIMTPSAADFVSLDTTLILLPRNADGTLPETTFMRLQEDSKFIDAGVDVGLEYDGKAPDLGCYEYGMSDTYPATLTCLTENTSQSVRQGSAIIDIIFKWGGSATDVNITELPDGLNSKKDLGAKTITISGTPTVVGTQSFTLSTIGGKTEAIQTVTIVVKDNSALEIGYVTIAGSDADSPILNRLNSIDKFTVSILDANNAANSYDQYALIIISPVPNSTAPAMTGLKGINKPMLLLKPFMLKNTVWNWGNSQNSAYTDMIITRPDHEIFEGINMSDNRLNCFSSVNTNGVTYIASWFSNTEPVRLATPLGSEGTSIAEIPIGMDMNGTKITQRFLMIGVSEYSTANLTPDALQLIENACYYLLDMSTTSTSTVNAADIKIGNGEITFSGQITEPVRIYDILGKEILTTQSNHIPTQGLNKGLYIITIGKEAIKIVL